jgi:hydroxyacylglutathione hydrolase
MITVEQLTYNPFQENTFLVYDETNDCVVIDPGMYTQEERIAFENHIKNKGLNLVKLISTHSHLDHVFGNAFVAETFNLGLQIHKEDLQTLEMFDRTVALYQIPNTQKSPMPSSYFEEGDKIEFGNSHLDIVFVPGHAPGHVAFISHKDKFVINGDCLFYGSIGRTDLPGGNHDQLLDSIRTKLFILRDDYKVYCGHGPATTIGFEKQNNSFLK